MDKFCISYCGNNFNEFAGLLKKESLVELRLDLCNFTDEQIHEAVTNPAKIILTYQKDSLSDSEFERLIKLIGSGIKYIDISYNYDEEHRTKLIEAAKESGCNTILSYHNFEKTPVINELKIITEKLASYKPDIIKIACKVNSEQVCSIILSLYLFIEDIRQAHDNEIKLIAIGMGEFGKITRIASIFLGAPFTYVSYKKGSETAAGQIDIISMKDIVNIINKS